MKNTGKPSGIVKGMPSGMLLSLAIHAGAFLLAGMLVVFTVSQKKEKKFVPPKPVDRPKMKLKKPKVKVKKNARPKATTRIVTHVQKADMPDIQLPELGGMGTGLTGGSGIGGFDLLPQLDTTTVFGGGHSIGNDFVGTLYDFKRDRRGGPTGVDPDAFLAELAKFTKSDWKAIRLSRYYQAPKKLYTTTFMIPTMNSAAAPTAFGEPDMIGYAWAVIYKGQLVHPKGGRFRFWAQADDIIIVRVNGETVVDGSVSDAGAGSFRTILSDYNDNATADSMKYYMGERPAEVGKWFTLEPGVPLDMQVVIGECPGGSFSAMLAVQEEGVEYPRSPQGGPLLPMFKTAQPTHDTLDAIYEHLVPGEVCLTNGPIFCDYGTGYSETERQEAAKRVKPAPADREDQPAPVSAEVVSEPSLRVWTLADGKTLEGAYVRVIGDKLIIKTAREKQVRIPYAEISDADVEYIQLSNPPEFKMDFRATSRQRQILSRTGNSDVPSALQWTFGAKVRQLTAVSYNHELTIDYFAIGQQVQDRAKFILLDRGSRTFTLTRENDRKYEFLGDQAVELMKYTVADQNAGRQKYGYLLLLRDKTGRIIQHDESNAWLWKNHENLARLPVGAFMDKRCVRVYPTGLKPTKY